MAEFNLQSFIISVVIVGVTLVIGIYVTSEIAVTSCATYNATNGLCYDATTNYSFVAGNNVVTALATGTSWVSILVVVGFATIILTMLTSGLGAAASQAGTPYY
jgi:hypothetical protein